MGEIDWRVGVCRNRTDEADRQASNWTLRDASRDKKMCVVVFECYFFALIICCSI